MNDWRARTSTFYGWWIVTALFVILFNFGGMGMYCFPVFIESLQKEFSWSITEISLSAALWAIIFGFSGPIVGSLISRFGARKIMLLAAILGSLINLGFASMSRLWMLYALNMLAGFVIAGTTLIPAQTLITNWFDRYRGRAMALAMIGIGSGGFLLPPFNEWLIRTIGWRQTFAFSFAVVWVLLIPIIALFIRTKPSELGLEHDGIAKAKHKPVRKLSGLTVREAVRTSSFWLLIAIYILQLIVMSSMNFHLVPFATQQAGFSSQNAAFYYGLAVGISIAGRLLFGWLADRWRPNILIAAAGIFMAAGPALLDLIFVHLGANNARLLGVHSILYGIGLGGNAVVFPILTGRCFGELHFPKIMGLIMSGFALGIIVGVPVSAMIFDRTGSYHLALLLCSVAAFLSSVFALFVVPGKIKKSQRSA